MKQFIDTYICVDYADWNSYRIENDSCTDKNTGVTHVHVRQVMNGMDVVDGDANVNVLGGRVLFYGNSV